MHRKPFKETLALLLSRLVLPGLRKADHVALGDAATIRIAIECQIFQLSIIKFQCSHGAISTPDQLANCGRIDS